MKLLLCFLMLSFTIFAQEKKGHAIEPGDFKNANCLSPIDGKLTVDDIIIEAKKLGHDLSRLVADRRFELIHIQDIYYSILLMPKGLKVGLTNEKNYIKYYVKTDRNAVASAKKNKVYINPLKWHAFHRQMRIAIIFHELSHILGYVNSKIDDSHEWVNIDGGWGYSKRGLRKDGTIFQGRSLNKAGNVSKYSMVNPAEDFAESVTAYRLNPELLMNSSEKRYNFLKENIFFGIEYLEKNECEQNILSKVDLKKIERKVLSKFKRDSYFKSARKYVEAKLLRKKLSNKDIERIYYITAIRKIIEWEKDIKRKHEYRLYLIHLDNYKLIENEYSRKDVKELKLTAK